MTTRGRHSSSGSGAPGKLSSMIASGAFSSLPIYRRAWPQGAHQTFAAAEGAFESTGAPSEIWGDGARDEQLPFGASLRRPANHG